MCAADCVRFYLMGYKTIVYLKTKGIQTERTQYATRFSLDKKNKRPERSTTLSFFWGGGGGGVILHHKSAELKSKNGFKAIISSLHIK